MRTIAVTLLVPFLGRVSAGGEARFSSRPTARRARGKVSVAFSVSAPTDVEVAVLDSRGRVVRHLAAGVLGGKKPPPEPLKRGLRQKLEWDMRDDFKKPAKRGPFKVRVRAGMGVKFGRFIGADPYNFGRVVSSATDEDGNVYILGFAGQLNQGHMSLRVFDKQGRYLREIVPFPANLPKDAVKDVARWDEEAKAFRPRNRRNLNPDFYGQPGSSNVRHHSMILASASKKDGVVLTGKGRTVVLETTGAVRSSTKSGGAAGPGDMAPFNALRAKLKAEKQPDWFRVRAAKAYRDTSGRFPRRGEKPIDWRRLAVDYERDEVYVNDGVCLIWRFDGRTGEGRLLMKGNEPLYAADLAVGYDGLLYVRRCRGNTPGISDFSGPFERYTRELAPAPYPGGTHVLSDYIYGRYGVGYADRGIGVGPDGKVYISFMYKWVKYCTAGFGPDGKALKGKYLEGQVGGTGRKGFGDYPPGLKSAIIGPMTGANGGVRVDLKGDIYLGLWLWPKDPAIPRAFERDGGYKYSVGSVVKFTPDGGFMAVRRGWLGADPIDIIPRTPGARGMEAKNSIFGELFIEGATAVYQGLAPFSHSPYAGNSCCVCRVPSFDLDRWGRLAMPNAITNSVLLVDNSGNLILEFGKYGNFDSQYVNPFETERKKKGKPIVSVPEIPLAWPTGAGFSENHIYVNDTYSRRAVRVDKTCAAEETCAVR